MSVVKKGDTIVEVLFSVAIFGLVAIIVLSIMNRGLVTAQAALEVDSVRNQMNSQAEMIRLMSSASKIRTHNQSFDKNYYLENFLVPTSQDIQPFEDMVDNNNNCVIPNNSFVVDVRKGYVYDRSHITQAGVFSQLIYGHGQDSNKIENNKNFIRSEGLWVQGRRVTGEHDNANANTYGNDDFNAIDFHIRACWVGPSSSRPITLATIVRVYDER